MGRGSYNGGSTIIRCHPVGLTAPCTKPRTPAQIEDDKARARSKAKLERAQAEARVRRAAAKRATKKIARNAAKAEVTTLATKAPARIKEREQRERAKAAAANVIVEHRKRRTVKLRELTSR